MSPDMLVTGRTKVQGKIWCLSYKLNMTSHRTFIGRIRGYLEPKNN